MDTYDKLLESYRQANGWINNVIIEKVQQLSDEEYEKLMDIEVTRAELDFLCKYATVVYFGKTDNSSRDDVFIINGDILRLHIK